MTVIHSQRRGPRRAAGMRRLVSGGFLGLTGLVLAGCVSGGGGPAEGIGFREARFQEISAIREYRACVDDAVNQTKGAKARSNPAGYVASAKLLEQCESNLGPEAKDLAQEERMRAYALSIMNYVRGGDIVKARANLETFKSSFPGKDLSLPDGSSFIDTADLLTGGIKASDANKVTFLDVSSELRAEVSRVRFWKRN